MVYNASAFAHAVLSFYPRRVPACLCRCAERAFASHPTLALAFTSVTAGTFALAAAFASAFTNDFALATPTAMPAYLRPCTSFAFAPDPALASPLPLSSHAPFAPAFASALTVSFALAMPVAMLVQGFLTAFAFASDSRQRWPLP